MPDVHRRQSSERTTAPGRLPRCMRDFACLRIAVFGRMLGSHGRHLGTRGAWGKPSRTLDDWKNGEEPDALNNSTPAITAQDLDWMGGATLVNYEVTGDGKTVKRPTCYVPVTLTLKKAEGKEVEKEGDLRGHHQPEPGCLPFAPIDLDTSRHASRTLPPQTVIDHPIYEALS